MKLNINECVGCGACYSICPKNSITMKCNREGFLYPKIVSKSCIDCNNCKRVCPILDKDRDYTFDRTAYACYTKYEDIRLNSSSGGIFTELAQLVLKQGGIVFGAAFSDDFTSVRHIAVDNVDDLQKLRGSKYVQSDTGDTYKKAEEYLKQDRVVFFTGTPCQVAGLKKYLGKDYDNLLTQDLICHGVPSPMVWKKYVKYRNNKSNSGINKISFRDKEHGWKKFRVLFEFEDNTRYINEISEDVYMLGFLRNLYLRYSCYKCKFKNGRGNSDITLADFWGIKNVFPEMDDDKGTSFAIINSKKGQMFFNKITQNLVLKEASIDYAEKYNIAYFDSVEMPDIRNRVFKYIKVLGVFYGIQTMLGLSIKKRVLLKLKRVFNLY